MRRLHSLFGITIAGAGLIAIPPLVAPMPAAQIRAVQLTSGAADIGILPLALLGAAL
jgi:hypothetical protein